MEKWILLTKKAGASPAGPFAEEELNQMISQGRISLDDFVWRAGLKNWIPLKNIRNFNPEIIHSAIDNANPKEQQQLLSEGVYFERNPAKLKLDFIEDLQQIPKEAKTPNLVPENPNLQSLQHPSAILVKNEKTRCEPMHFEVPEVNYSTGLFKEGFYFFTPSKQQKWIYVLMVIIIIIGCLYGFIL